MICRTAHIFHVTHSFAYVTLYRYHVIFVNCLTTPPKSDHPWLLPTCFKGNNFHFFMFPQVFLKDTSDHEPQQERIMKRSKYLILEVNNSSSSDIRLGVKSAQTRWRAMFNRLENLVNRQRRVTTQAEKFEQLHQEVNHFLTEAELKLIELDPYTSDDEPRVQLEKLKVRKRYHSDHIEVLVTLCFFLTFSPRACSSI